MISLEDVDFGYRPGECVLRGVSLEVPAGLTLVLGPNGAGKSTFLKLVAGIERPDGGTISIGGFDLWRDETAARQDLAYVPEQPDLTPYATILDVLLLVCRLRGQPDWSAREVLDRAGLHGMGRRSVRELSMGQRRRAVMAAAWIGKPNVLILDEPLEALDRSMRDEVVSWTLRARSRGASVLVATHEIETFASSASRALALSCGTCRLVDPLPEECGGRMTLLENLSRGKA